MGFHHLSDPAAGLGALASVLAPEGAMQLMVYAPYGRTGVYMIQDYCRRLEIGSSPAEIADLVASLRELPIGHPLSHLLRETPDFQHDDALADALLHPHDRAYSVPQLLALVRGAGLRFGVVAIPEPTMVVVEDRLPPGAAAALLNRAHTSTDLVLFLDSDERRMLEQIDGRRSVAEIDDDRARSLVERLWRHDLVVIDSSTCPEVTR